MALEPILDAGIQWTCAGADTPDRLLGYGSPCSNAGVVFVWVYVRPSKYPSQFAFCETHLRELAAPLLEPADV